MDQKLGWTSCLLNGPTGQGLVLTWIFYDNLKSYGWGQLGRLKENARAVLGACLESHLELRLPVLKQLPLPPSSYSSDVTFLKAVFAQSL